MAASSMALTAANIKTLENTTVNAVADMNTTISEISTKFNAMLETSTGHHHDGTNSRSVSATIFGLTMSEFAVATIMGMFD